MTSGELPAAQFTDMVRRWLQAGGLPEVGVETLLSRAVGAADARALLRQRASLREQIAAATRTAAGDPRKLLTGFAASAQAGDQLAVIGAWLARKARPKCSPSTPSCGRGSCLPSPPAGWRAGRTSTRCRGSTLSPAR